MENLPNKELFLPTKNFLSLLPVYNAEIFSCYIATWIGVPLHHHSHPLVDPLPSPFALEINIF